MSTMVPFRRVVLLSYRLVILPKPRAFYYYGCVSKAHPRVRNIAQTKKT
jgi:hypothetical protein